MSFPKLPIYSSSGFSLNTIGSQVFNGLNNASRSASFTPAEDLPVVRETIQRQMYADFGIDPPLEVAVRESNANIYQNGLGSADNLFQAVLLGQINLSNVEIFSDPTTVLTLAGADPTLFNNSLVDVANIYSYLGLQYDVANPLALASSLGANSGQTINGELAMPFRSQAAALAQSSALIPKMKFLFVLQIIFNNGYQLTGSRSTGIATSLTFLLKNWNRPTLSIEYDDINMYNFRTKVPKLTKYEPVTMQFIDDESNIAMTLLMMIMRAVSPIFNMKDPVGDLGDQGMNFEGAGGTERDVNGNVVPITGVDYKGIMNNAYSASFGALQNFDLWKSVDAESIGVSHDITTPIQSIRIYHVFNAARSVNVYNFTNPRVIQFQMDQLTMSESGDGCQISMQFAYDGLYIDEGAAASAYKDIVQADINGVGININPYTETTSHTTVMSNSNTTRLFNPIAQPYSPDSPIINPFVPLFNGPADTEVTNVEQLGELTTDVVAEEVGKLFSFSSPPEYV